MKPFATTFALAAALAFASSSVAFAQAGGPDVPSGAASQGAKENGASSTGGKGSMKSGKMSKKKKKAKGEM